MPWKKASQRLYKGPLRKEFLEDFVVDNVVKLLSEKQTCDKMISALMQKQEDIITDNADLQRLTKEYKTTELQISNIMVAIENGGTSATVMNRMRELEQKKKELEKAITIQKSQTADRVTEKEMRAFYQEALKLEANLLINVLIKQITLYDDKMIITYNSPIKEGPDGSRDFSFYQKTLNMPYKGQKIKIEVTFAV